MARVIGRTFFWPDDDEIKAAIVRAIAITGDIDPPPEHWAAVFGVVVNLCTQCNVEMVQQGGPVDLRGIAKG